MMMMSRRSRSPARAHRAAHDHAAAGHAGKLAGERRGEEIAGVAVDLDAPGRHAARDVSAGVAIDLDRPAARLAAQTHADVALDMDSVARQQLRADEVETLRAALEAQLMRVAGADLEEIADPGRDLGRREVDRLDLLGALAEQAIGRELREVEPLRRLVAERENQRLHDRRSFK